MMKGSAGLKCYYSPFSLTGCAGSGYAQMAMIGTGKAPEPRNLPTFPSVNVTERLWVCSGTAGT